MCDNDDDLVGVFFFSFLFFACTLLRCLILFGKSKATATALISWTDLCICGHVHARMKNTQTGTY